MWQQKQVTIDRFITRVERILGTTFNREVEPTCIALDADSLDLGLCIYLPGAEARRPNKRRRTIHIDYDQVISDADKLCARLASLYGKGEVIFARKTVVARVDKRISMQFLQEHHLQQAIPGKYRYGLFHEGELVSIAIFSGGRHMRDKYEAYRSFELIRFCHKSNLRVVGGLSKLLKAFIKDFQPDDIMTYVDRDWSQDSNLSTLGFQTVDSLAPQCYSVSNGSRTLIKAPNLVDLSLGNAESTYFIRNSGSTKLVLRL